MRTCPTDISGRGCYVETLLPFPVSTALTITFWLDSEKVLPRASCAPAMVELGMGIEFTGLTEDTEKRLQLFIEKLEKGAEEVSEA